MNNIALRDNKTNFESLAKASGLNMESSNKNNNSIRRDIINTKFSSIGRQIVSTDKRAKIKKKAEISSVNYW